MRNPMLNGTPSATTSTTIITTASAKNASLRLSNGASIDGDGTHNSTATVSNTVPGEKQRIRRFTPKTRTGCLTCKRRRVKCDERKPTCAACDKVKAKCEGYAVPKAWIFEPAKSSSPGDGTDDSGSSGEGGNGGGGQGSGELSLLVTPVNVGDSGNPIHVVEANLWPDLFKEKNLLEDGGPNGESAVIMEAYLDLSSDCPMAWDTSLYRTRQLNATPVAVDDSGALLWKDKPLDPTPLRHQSHLVLATAMLCFTKPQRFPQRLYLKYMARTVGEIRAQIAKRCFSVEDLLSGISQTLLACILQDDVESTVAHLRAAAGLVESLGGIDNVDPNIAAVLRYSDFHFAVECGLAPVFPLVVDLRETYEGRFEGNVDELAAVVNEIKRQAKTLLPWTMEMVVRRFTNCALALAKFVVGAREAGECLDYNDLNWMASHSSGTLYILLGVYPSVLSTEFPFLQQSPLAESYTVLMIMWFQLLICRANETLTNVGVKLNLLPVRGHCFRDECTFSSDRIEAGLREWNKIIYAARAQSEDDTGEWIKLIDICEDMEQELPVRVAPVMRGLLAVGK